MQNTAVKLLSLCTLIIMSIVIVTKIFTSNGNQVGNTILYVTIILGVVGFLSPKIGLLLFLVLQFYIDYIKRFLVFGDSTSQQDVIITLLLGVFIIISISTNIAYRCITGKLPFYDIKHILFLFVCVVVSISGLLFATDYSITSLMQALVGTSMIGMTAYSSYYCIAKKDDIFNLLRCLVIGSIPMALYTLYQARYGITAWEENYIKMGFSTVLHNFYIIDGIDHMRPFSTLNTHTSVGAMSGILFLISFFLMPRAKNLFGIKKINKFIYIFISIVFILSCYYSKNRTTYLVPFLGVLLIYAFRNRWTILLFYTASMLFFVWIVLNSEWLHDDLLSWSLQFEKTSIGTNIGSLGTYQDRLKGFVNLKDLSYWTPFGLSLDQMPFTHDKISEAFLRLGYIPTSAILSTGVLFIFYWHRCYLNLIQKNDRLLMAYLTALLVSTSICGLLYGNLLFVAPVNSTLGCLLGISFSIYRIKPPNL